MFDIIKKIFAVLSNFPAFTTLFKKATRTGKIDPIDAINALSTVSQGTKKISDTAINAVQQGGNLSDAARAISNIGEIEVLGQKINTKSLIPDLKRAGGICSVLANVLEKMPNQSPEEVEEFGKVASNVSNWSDVIKQSNL